MHENILRSDEQIRHLLSEVKTIAVLGIKPDSHASQPAYYVPRYMADQGYDIIPVPVYYPEVTEILGRTVYRDLNEIPGEIDLVNIFRQFGRSETYVRGPLEKAKGRVATAWDQE